MTQHDGKKCLLLLICALSVHICSCAWHRANVSNGFLKIFVPDDVADIFLPIRGNYFIFHPSINTDYYDFCAFAETQNTVNCTNYFCSPQYVNYTVQWNPSNKRYHAMMHNYCNYCVTENRTADMFTNFHSIKNSCSNFVPFNFSCGSEADDLVSNFPYFSEFSFNYSSSLSPFVCYCGGFDRYAYQCDAWNSFGIPFAFEGYKVILIIVGSVVFLVNWFASVLPIFGTAFFEFIKSENKKQSWINLFDLRLQSLCSVTFGLFFIIFEQYYGLLYKTKGGKGIRRFPIGTFRTLAEFLNILSYSLLLVMMYVTKTV